MKQICWLTARLLHLTVNSRISSWPDREAGLRKGAKHETRQPSEVRNEVEVSLKTIIYVNRKADYN